MQYDSQRLKKILIQTKRQVFSEIPGDNASILKGEGYDFCELREYEYGEDVKNIDWVISAKMQKPYVKLFHAQKELNIVITALMSGSIFFGSQRLKQELLTEIAAILGYSSIKQNDPFTSFVYNSTLHINTQKTKKISAVKTMSEQFFNYACLGKSIDYAALQTTLVSQIKKRSILFLIGDFIECNDLDLKLLNRKHEVCVIILRDKYEEKPIELGNVHLIDSNNYRAFEGSISPSLIASYQAQIKKADHELFTKLQKSGIKFTKIYTHENPISKLIGLLHA
ncbi:DUF58 domain-containing protein [Candidatus Marinarcus aquaticus]|uniref:DUF58 domain-containing protein n=1 Tax=Candidatus Marinarcus aquaticus TaxID=2044504 RepID=A0A4Q0XSM2_9BACT|nr:DUF58 domain-containing protein [Candidatus Marinarcus aquaticus]RXJ60507.1 DUF58 domain-containing protein [Candidatus Marinarcus aquaticus]